MTFMFVTLDVLKLSDWLNAVAYCRESNGGHTMRGSRCEQRAERGGFDSCRFGARQGEERTRNMPSMSVTLEVSKFSGWLNA